MREAKGWSQNRLATEIGLRWHSLEKLESGTSVPTLATLLALVRAFDLVSIEEVLGDGRLGTALLLKLESDEAAGLATSA
jgi:DNA-binding XRE family transcriptional regulator